MNKLYPTPTDRTLTILRQLVWLTPCKSERTTFLGLDDDGFRLSLADETKRGALARHAKYAIEIRRNKFRVIITRLRRGQPTACWQMQFLSRAGLNNYLGDLLLDNKTWADARKIKSVKRRLAKFLYDE
jgi:alpha-D-ribose 1-methylphosphonate 5-triphosphate synthase subunit PhnI